MLGPLARVKQMFCPLCTSEFRDGFTTCRDCHIALVPNVEQARAGRVRLWKGNRQKKLDRILAALDTVQIPSYFKELVNVQPRISIMGIRIGSRRSRFEYEVWILRRDLERAHMAVADDLHGAV